MKQPLPKGSGLLTCTGLAQFKKVSRTTVWRALKRKEIKGEPVYGAEYKVVCIAITISAALRWHPRKPGERITRYCRHRKQKNS